MKRFLSILTVLAMIFCLAGCGGSVSESTESQTGHDTDETTHEHTIGVLSYSRTSEETMAFADYLNDYIAGVFNVNFLYSDSITSEEEELDFIDLCAANDVDGILSFNSYDLKTEVEACAADGIYYMMASGSVSDEQFDAVSDNPYFLGVVGPGSEVEYQAGADMAAWFYDQAYGDEYFILSGGASMGNEMHLQRTEGILDTLKQKYGVTFDASSSDLAASAEIIHAEAGDLKVCIVPGYLDFEDFLKAAEEEYEKDQYTNVLSVLPGSAMEQTLLGAHVGIIDCFSESNMNFFNEGELCYVAGKYGALIGPSFAAMYNAVTGHADSFREDGKAFRIEQGFWTSTDKLDYQKKYTLAASLELTAYNFDDLYSVCSVYTPDADLDDLKELAAAFTYEAVVERRGL